MNQTEKQLLENIFDSLDRLFDRKCQIEDLHDLLFASDIALKKISSNPICLGDYLDKLKTIMIGNVCFEEGREKALIETQKLREELNEILTES